MSSRIEKGNVTFRPRAIGRRPPAQSPAPNSLSSATGAMSPPPPSSTVRSHLRPSASPHPSSSSTGAIRSYASVAPSSSRVQTTGQPPLLKFRPPTARPASIVPGASATAASHIVRPPDRTSQHISTSVSQHSPAVGDTDSEKAARNEKDAQKETGDAVAAVAAATPKTIADYSKTKLAAASASKTFPPHPRSAGPSTLRRPQSLLPPAVEESASTASSTADARESPTTAGQRGDRRHILPPMAGNSNVSTYNPSNIQFPPPPGRLPTCAEGSSAPAIGSHNERGEAILTAIPRTKRLRKRPSENPGNSPISPTAVSLFSQTRTAALREEHPDLTSSELSKRIQDTWAEASDQEKAYWQRKCHELRNISVHERKERNVSSELEQETTRNPDGLTGSGTDTSENIRTRKKRSKHSTPHKTGKKRKTFSEQPKKPASAYILYSQEARRSVAGSDSQGHAQKESFAELSKRIGAQWSSLPSPEKQPYLRQADELKVQYQAAMNSWKAGRPNQAAEESDIGHSERERVKRPRNAQKKPTQRSISDDEREYETLIAQHGDQLEDLRIDPQTTSMADLAMAELKSGRASTRLFELGRVRTKQLGDAAAVRKTEREQLKRRIEQTEENLRRQKAGQLVTLPKYNPKEDQLRRRGNLDLVTAEKEQQPQAAQAQAVVTPDSGRIGRDGEEEEEVEALPGTQVGPSGFVVPALDDDEDGEAQEQQRIQESFSRALGGGLDRHLGDDVGADEPSDACSDAGSVRSATSAGTYASLRETAHVPQMRVVDGHIVLDEASLTVNRNEEQTFEEHETIDEEIGHKFVNSSTGTKREKSIRWTLAETEKFFKAVSMWGSDFEMISRMFPNRSRKQVKNKWTREERASPARLDLAFARKLPVDLENYAILANVDLSGPAPHVGDGTFGEEESLLIKKGEEDDEGGRSWIAEGERRKISKVSSTPDPSRQRRGSSPGMGEVPRSKRDSSVASARSGAGADASSSRQHLKSRQQIERENREAREKSHRADSLLEGRDKRSLSRGTSRGAAGATDAIDQTYPNGPDEEEVMPLPDDY